MGVDTVDTADIVHTVDTHDIVSSVNSVHSVQNVLMAHPNMEDANVAHPNMEDAYVVPLNVPDGDFPSTNLIIIISKSTGWPFSGRKSTEIGIWDWDLDPTVSPSSNKGFPGPPGPKTP